MMSIQSHGSCHKVYPMTQKRLVVDTHNLISFCSIQERILEFKYRQCWLLITHNFISFCSIQERILKFKYRQNSYHKSKSLTDLRYFKSISNSHSVHTLQTILTHRGPNKELLLGNGSHQSILSRVVIGLEGHSIDKFFQK